MTDKESLTGIEQDVQIEERTKHAMENYSQWLQNAMSASPWGYTELNKKLLSYSTENVTTAVGLVQKLRRRLSTTGKAKSDGFNWLEALGSPTKFQRL
jgi:hypothetical protein